MEKITLPSAKEGTFSRADLQAKGYRRVVSLESFVFLAILLAFYGYLIYHMGIVNLFNTLMNTAYDLLMSTVFYIMAIAVLAGAISALLTEFGVVSLLNKAMSPLMGPIYGLPGASVLGIITTYLSDNPAILSLANDQSFRRYFKQYQLPALTNIGTSFGMGMIITAFMISQQSPSGENLLPAALIGNLGTIIGSIISVRLMLRFAKKKYPLDEHCTPVDDETSVSPAYRSVRQGNPGTRFIEALLDGGKSGVEMVTAIVPGVLIICTMVMLLTNGASGSGMYTGAAYEGVALLPWVGEKLQFLLKPLFGFESAEALAVPVTALGAAGAAIGLIPRMLQEGIIHGNDIAVFTAMCMCWSGYLSTHIAMMESLKVSHLTGKAILSHTIGGLCAGISAHWLYQLFILLF